MIITRVATAIVVVIVVAIGGVVVLTHGDLTFPQYLHDVAIAVGLLGVAYGIDAHSKP